MRNFAYLKKVPVLVLAVLIGFGNFAYAFTGPVCASMMMPASQGMKMGMAANHDCCKKPVPCECSIEVPSSDRAMPERIQMEPLYAQLSFSQASQTSFLESTSKLNIFISESPPKEAPLYDLYSSYLV